VQTSNRPSEAAQLAHGGAMVGAWLGRQHTCTASTREPLPPLPGKKAIDPTGDTGLLAAKPPRTPGKYCPIFLGKGPPW